jgi:hypothetical protein
VTNNVAVDFVSILLENTIKQQKRVIMTTPAAVAYIATNRYENFVPTLGAITMVSGHAVVVPDANSIPHIDLDGARRALLELAPLNALVFLNPISADNYFPTVNQLYEVNR